MADGRPQKYLRIVEILADQLGTEDFTFAHDQFTIGLPGEEYLGDASNDQRIKDASQKGKYQREL